MLRRRLWFPKIGWSLLEGTPVSAMHVCAGAEFLYDIGPFVLQLTKAEDLSIPLPFHVAISISVVANM